jgi:hypothetical protein
MTDNLHELAAELSKVDAAIQSAALYADPADPTSSFSDELVELVAREEQLVEKLIREARDATAVQPDATAAQP